MAGDVPVTPEMIAAGWSIVNDGRKWPPRIGSGPGLVEVYRAMRALEPATTHQRTLEALREAREALLVFAAFSDKAEHFVEHKAKFGGTAIFPVKDFRLAHFRKAVEVVALIDSILPGDTP